ncbi:DDE-type integrase/transposase/recombinase [Brucella tritici]|uniref:DDE-type integrase/transposase/recombinase n=1 Tax=Brucella tritici TaxID=94626 RepID=UPI001590F150|nr:DDE-type integrase/transposase/recombinase [Brucella tritici]
MNSYFAQPATFQRSLVNMRKVDRLSYKNAHWIPVCRGNEGWHIKREDDSHEVVVGHQELYNEISAGRASVRYGYQEPEQQKLRIIFGDKKFSDFPEKVQKLALVREKLINRYDAEFPEYGRKRWNNEKLQHLLNTWHAEIQSNLLPSASRADRPMELTFYRAPSVKTFWRDYTKYHGCGGDALGLVQRHHGPGIYYRSADPESIAFAHSEALRYMDNRKKSKAQVYQDYLAKLFEMNSSPDSQLKKVSRTKFESIIDGFDEYAKVAGRHGEAYAKRRLSSVKRSFHFEVPGDRIEMDFWNVELMSLFVETGMWSLLPESYRNQIGSTRIWFAAAIDVSTRYVLAFKASTNPNAANAVEAIRMIMSDKTHISTALGCETPWIGRLRPRQIYCDNGKEFVSQRTQEVLRNARIAFTRPPAGEPQARPFIERLFKTIGPMVAHHFDGRTFGSIQEKGDYNPEERLSLQSDELIKFFLYAICDIYHNTKHEGLAGGTPHNAWVKAASQYPIDVAPDEEEMLHIFGQKVSRRISSYGVSFMGIPYSNDELTRLRLKHGQTDFEIKYDPANLRSIAVYAGKDKGWFSVENQIGLDDNVSLEEWIVARQQLRLANAKESESGLAAMYRAINKLRTSGDAAMIRAKLGARSLDSNALARLEAELCGSWIAKPDDQMQRLEALASLPGDLKLADESAFVEYQTVQKKEIAAAKRAAKSERLETRANNTDTDLQTETSVSRSGYYDEF